MNETQSTEAATWVPISTVQPWDENPWDHPPEQVRELADSIKAYGWGRTILAQSGTGRIIGGHGIRLAMLSLLAEDPEYNLPGSPSPGFVPVRFVDVSDQKATALALMDNRASRLSKQDDEAVGKLLGALLDSDLPTGFDDEEKMALVAATQAVEDIALRVPEGFVDETVPSSNELGDADYEPSQVRMVQLFLDNLTHPGFMADIMTLQNVWKSNDLTETVLRAVSEKAREVVSL